MKKYLSTGLLALCTGMVFGQNYVSGPIGLYGPQYNPATTIGSTGSVTVGASGVYTLAGSLTSTPRSSSNGVTFTGGGTYASASQTIFIDGYVSEVGNTAFTFPTGDGTATAGNQYHPLAVSAPSTSATVTISYNATTTPNKTRAQLSVDSVDALAYYTMASSVSTTATATASVQAQTNFKTSATLLMSGYNTSATKWQDLHGTTTASTAAQNLATLSMDLSQYSYLTVGGFNPLVVSPYVFLQGASNGTATMTTNLHNVIPTAQQPYTVSPFAYAGTESIASVPTNMTDWIMVELRDPATPTTVIATRAALLMNDGTITDVDGVSPVSFVGQTPGNYYVALRHRNHLGIRSSSALALNGYAATTLDFRSVQANAYQNTALANPAMKDLGNGSFAMYGGNINSNTTTRVSGTAALSDYVFLINTALGGDNTSILTATYNAADVNMNGVVRVSGTAAISDYVFLINTALGGDNTLILTSHN